MTTRWLAVGRPLLQHYFLSVNVEGVEYKTNLKITMFLEDVSRKIVVKRDVTAAKYTKFRQSTKSKHLIEFEVFHFLMPLSF